MDVKASNIDTVRPVSVVASEAPLQAVTAPLITATIENNGTANAERFVEDDDDVAVVDKDSLQDTFPSY